jgi:hypothetical protein
MNSTNLLDQALNIYSPGCQYETVNAEAGVDGFWFKDWVPGPNGAPSPSVEAVEALIKEIVDQGGAIDVNSGISAFLAIMGTAAFAKIMDAADRRAAILLYGVVAMAAMLLYLYAPSPTTGAVAIAGWNRFAIYAKRYRDLTGLVEDDILEFNAQVDALSLPQWLKLNF